jgi:hypothetical protein
MNERFDQAEIEMIKRQIKQSKFSRLIPGTGNGEGGSRLRRKLCSFGAAIAYLLVLTSMNAAHAQSAASVSGTVTDQNGAVISHVHVALANSDTGVVQSTETNGSGSYAFISVSPGQYQLEYTRDGFATAKQTNISLGVNQAALFNLTLVPGSVQQTVTVSTDSSTVQNTTATLGTVIATKTVNDLPLNGRNFTQMLELTPGVSRVTVAQNASGGQTSNPIGTFTFPSVNGQRNRANMFLLDGGNDLNSYNGAYNYEPIIDDVQEFKVQSHNDLAEFGQVTGGIVNVVTKSGTNHIHGSMWEFIRNSAFDARNYFATVVNPLHQNQFGATLGGPVTIPRIYNGKDRTFFFFAYEGYRQSQAAQTLLIAPTTAQLNGDFSNLLSKGIVIYNPFSTRPDPAKPGQYLRDPFPNNQIPTNLISNAALVYAKALFPAPTLTGVTGGNAYDNQGTRTNSDSYTGRVDHTFGGRDFLYGRFSEFNEPYLAATGNPNVTQPNVVSGYNLTVHEVHTFGSSSTLEGYFTRNAGHLVQQLAYPTLGSNFGQTLETAGFSNTFLTGYSTPSGNGIPGIAVTGYLSVPSSLYQDTTGSDVYEYGAAYSKILGRHNLKAGGLFATNNYREPVDAASEATSSFQTSNLENPTSSSGASTGDAMASFLLGVPTSAQRRASLEREHGGKVMGAYIQDQTKLTSRLTINLGARWDVSVWPVLGYLEDGEGYVGDMDLRKGIYILSAVPPACSVTRGAPCIPGGVLPAHVVVTPNSNRALHNTDYSNWQGRVGLAYQATERISIHAGYGRYYDEWSYVTQQAQSFSGTWPSVSLLTANSLNQTSPTVTIQDPLNLGSTKITPAATPFNNATYYRSPDMLSPYSDQWNIGIEQHIGDSTAFTVAYAGSHNSRIDLGGLSNTAQYAAPGTAADVASRRKYPYIIPTNFDDSTGNSNYHSLQTTLNKRTSGGLTYLISYTWSKSIDLACSGSAGVEGCQLQNPYNPQADRSVSGFDLTHIFSGSLVYELPFGTGRRYSSGHALVNSVLGGWQINTITSLSSGTPYTLTVSGDIANVGNTFVRPNLVGNPVPQHRSPNQWINPSAFVTPPRYTFGTFGRNALRSDWYRDVDLSVFKNFSLPERTSLEFRAEAFNLTNTTVFGKPGSTVGTPTFGVVSSTANTPRQLQFALKLKF